MNKKIILGLVAGLAFSLTAIVGCGGSGNNGGGAGGGGAGSGGAGSGGAGSGGAGSGGGSAGSGGGGGGGADMGFACVTSPTTPSDILNGCPEATVSKVDITPFFPALTPNGALPALQ